MTIVLLVYEAISHVGGIAPLVVEVKSFEEENLKKRWKIFFCVVYCIKASSRFGMIPKQVGTQERIFTMKKQQCIETMDINRQPVQHTRKNGHQKVTACRVSNFYRSLGLESLRSLPVGEFKLYDNVQITQSTGSGV